MLKFFVGKLLMAYLKFQQNNLLILLLGVFPLLLQIEIKVFRRSGVVV